MDRSFNWDVFVRDTQKLYMGVAMKSIGNVQDAEDIVQDTYFNLYNKNYDLSKLKFIGLTTVRNTSLNMYKSKMIRRNAGSNQLTVNMISGIRFFRSGIFLQMETDYILFTLKSNLTEYQFNIIMMYARGYSYQETADIYGIAIGTVKAMIYHIRSKFPKLFPKLSLTY